MIGILGGTFDPIHYGHLRPAQQVFHALGLEKIHFVPAANPPHRRTPVASCRHRLRMVELALAGRSGLCVDDREARRQGPSYTVITLESLQADFEPQPLCLLMGMDAFRGIELWYQWERLLQLAHIVVMQRPGWPTPQSDEELPLWARGSVCDDRQQLVRKKNGLIVFQSVVPQDISASDVRAMIAKRKSAQEMLPDPVWAYICNNHLYGYSNQEA